ncbi:MAG: hypothetical protein JWM68_5185 [Verrucomicrobiales bacterium]|nr:hypothetical protein [Verrucomicrobiales bacterium]
MEPKVFIPILLTLITAISGIIFSVLSNNRASKDFELRMRPYLNVDLAQFVPPAKTIQGAIVYIDVRNSGLIPAVVVKHSVECFSVDGTKNFADVKTQSPIIAKDQVMHIGTALKEGTVRCVFRSEYHSAIPKLSKTSYDTTQTFRIAKDDDGFLITIPETAVMN